MDNIAEEPFVILLAACLSPPPDNNQEITKILQHLLVILHSPQPTLNLRFRHFQEDETVFTGRDVFMQFSDNRYYFYQLTGETQKPC